MDDVEALDLAFHVDLESLMKAIEKEIMLSLRKGM